MFEALERLGREIIVRRMPVRQVTVLFSLFFLFFAGPNINGATKIPNGQKIYRSQCAKCHGNRGEGVKDKYDDPLEGDWSVAKLTRYIDKNMPDDDPKNCVGPE